VVVRLVSSGSSGEGGGPGSGSSSNGQTAAQAAARQAETIATNNSNTANQKAATPYTGAANLPPAPSDSTTEYADLYGTAVSSLNVAVSGNFITQAQASSILTSLLPIIASNASAWQLGVISQNTATSTIVADTQTAIYNVSSTYAAATPGAAPANNKSWTAAGIPTPTPTPTQTPTLPSGGTATQATSHIPAELVIFAVVAVIAVVVIILMKGE
jgi:hypothetical protein